MDSPQWPVLETSVEYSNEWFAAGVDLVERPDSSSGRYYWIEPSDSVNVVAVDEGDLVLVENYRPRLRRTFLECPGGHLDDGEDPVEAGRRELREETGYLAADVREVVSYYPSPWIRMQRTVVFAENLTPGPQQLEESEFPHVRRMPADAAVETAQTAPVAGWLLTPLVVARANGLI